MNIENTINENLYNEISILIQQARKKVVQSVNWTMVITYWEIGKRIVEEEQHGENRAEYGRFLIKTLSEKLTREFGKGFDKRNLFYMRQFYLTFPIMNALRSQLSWTHYRFLMKIEDEVERQFYMNESVDCSWSTRQLERQINSFYYQRLLASRDKKMVKAEAEQHNQPLKPVDVLKNPMVLEFLDLKENTNYLEQDLEKAILNKLQEFLLELGKGFSFVARQQRITTDAGKHYYIDLVFYNYLLKCFVLIDLKIGTLTPQDAGQMDMYVRLYEKLKKPEGDNPTLGIILCSERDETVVEFSVLAENKQLFASKYQLYIPTREELKYFLETERANLELEHLSDKDFEI
ncbi:MAG: PDDEXK nuclease domain-containing protein [Thermodesulfobacteriota bacterium]|nr:PDDEXK nuclease domain-containing protein [Thermodesulfobacteriota bacterium]